MVLMIMFNSCVILGEFNTLYLYLLAILSWPLAYDWATFTIIVAAPDDTKPED